MKMSVLDKKSMTKSLGTFIIASAILAVILYAVFVSAATPTITQLTLSPSSGIAKVGDTITLTITADATSYTANAITMNGVDVSGTLADNGDNTYNVTYIIIEGDSDALSGALNASVSLTDGVNPPNAPFTTVDVNTLAIDANTPTISIDDDASATWTNSDTIEVSVADTGYGVIADTKSIISSDAVCDVTKDGLLDAGVSGISVTANNDSIYFNKYICFRVNDTAGNKNYAVSSQITKLDTRAPVVPGTVISGFTVQGSFIKGTGDISTTSFLHDKVNALGISDLNTSSCRYSVNNGAGWNELDNSAWDEVQASPAWGFCNALDVNITDGLTYKFKIGILDNAGNLGTGTATATYTGDMAGPNSTMTGCAAGWSNISQTITINCNDNSGVGCKALYYELDGNSSLTQKSFPYSEIITSEGDHALYYYGIDQLDNAELMQTSYCAIDKTAPTVISVDSDGRVYNTGYGSPRITVTFSENVTEPTINVYPDNSLSVDDCLDGDDNTTWCFVYDLPMPAVDLTTETITINGAVDRAGNMMSEDSNHTFQMDNIAPTLYPVTISSDNANSAYAKIGDTVIISFTASEALNETPVVIIDANVASVTDLGGNSYSASYTFNGSEMEGLVTFSIDFNDTSGNPGITVFSTTEPSSVTFDMTAPNLYTVSIDQTYINLGNQNEMSFRFAGAETFPSGATYNYTITSDGGPGTQTGYGNIYSDSEFVFPIDVSGLADGTLTLNASLTDVVGNTGYGAIATVTKDTSAPIVEITYPLAPQSVNGSYVIIFTDDDLLNPQCSTDNNTWSLCMNGTTTFDDIASFSWAGEGDLTLYLRDTDAAGNIGTDEEIGLIKDTMAPSGYLVDFDPAYVNFANQSNISFTFSNGEINATYNYAVSDGGFNPDVTGYGTMTGYGDIISGIDVTSLNDGILNLFVTLTDPTGNMGTLVTDTVTKDTSAPSGYTVTIDQPYINASTQTAMSFTFALAEIGTTYNYTITSDGGPGTQTGYGTIVSGSDVISGIDVTGVDDGTLTLNATLTDTAGNTGYGVIDTVTKDTSAPTMDSVVIDDGDGYTNSAETGYGWNITVTTNGAEDGQNVDCNISDTGYGSFIVSGSLSSNSVIIASGDLSSLDDGTITVTCSVYDAVGNGPASNSVTSIKDTSAPTIGSIQNDGIWWNTDFNLIFTGVNWNVSGKSSAQYQIDSGAWQDLAEALPVGSWYGVYITGDGIFNVSYNFTDNAGQSTTGSLIAKKDSSNPLLILNGPEDGLATNLTTVVFNITATDSFLDNCTRYSDGLYAGIFTSLNNGTPTTYSLGSISDGIYNWSVTCYDYASNSVSSETRTYTIDTTSPTLNSTSVVKADTTADVSYEASENVNVTLNYGSSTSLGTSAIVNGQTGTFSLTGLSSETTYYYNLTLCDIANNCVTNGTFSFTTEATPSSSGGGSSGAAGYGIYTVTLSQLGSGYSKELAVGGSIKFMLNGEWHTAKILFIGPDYVTVQVMSEPQIVNISLSEEKSFDITSDGVMDLSIRLVSINSVQKTANLVFKTMINGTVTTITTPVIPAEEEKETVTEQITEAVRGKGVTSALIVGIIILAIIIYLVLRMRHKKHHAHHEQHEHEKKHMHHKKQFQD
jgi:hypothetical protein